MKVLLTLFSLCLLVLNACVSTDNADLRNVSQPDKSVDLSPAVSVKPIDIVVYRSPTCGCCEKWQAHLKKNNFNIKEIRTSEMPAIRDKYGVPQEMASCHTALVEGYVVEGHVPANEIKALLETKPKVVGIAIPSMPFGTPGMEMGDDKDAYEIIGFDREKHYQVLKSIKGN